MTLKPDLKISDAGGIRKLVARWTITGELILKSAAHFGAGTGEAADMTIIRDARTCAPLLCGTSIAGALRSHLADVLGGYRSEEASPVALLFGGASSDKDGKQSPLIVFDSIGNLQGQAVEIRDGVQINAANGTAEDKKKYDLEVLPAGTSFSLRFDLLVSCIDEENQLLNLLATSLSGFSNGDIAIGARRSRGLGNISSKDWRAIRYDLSSPKGWFAWISSDYWENNSVIKNVEPVKDIREACKHAHDSIMWSQLNDYRKRHVINVDLSTIGGLLVRSAPTDHESPDAVHIRSAGHSILPGTSVAGVLRTQALSIARLTRKDDDAVLLVNSLFGEVNEKNTTSSKLRISESFVEAGVRSRSSRICVDRFTQGVVPGALFDEEPENNGKVNIRIELREAKPGELGLIILVLKDLMTGNLAVGGTSSVGRGRFRGTAQLQMDDGRMIDLDPAQPVDSVVDQTIAELWPSNTGEGTA